jgi:4a-hydroxytetrahydrobiopterin dehydratase
MTPDEVAAALRSLDGWDARMESSQLHKHYRFEDFLAAMRFVNALAGLAEAEGHHPDFTLHSWNVVDVTLWTHAIGGLSENDFILAAKLDRLPESRGPDPR